MILLEKSPAYIKNLYWSLQSALRLPFTYNDVEMTSTPQ